MKINRKLLREIMEVEQCKLLPNNFIWIQRKKTKKNFFWSYTCTICWSTIEDGRTRISSTPLQNVVFWYHFWISQPSFGNFTSLRLTSPQQKLIFFSFNRLHSYPIAWYDSKKRFPKDFISKEEVSLKLCMYK